ncbi:hypothetical protein HELRODRAFT_172360 [Helobdella robusta]|uniref:Uncharacterized protein n=1 Tax=Helobdella robusta TaxID=6412 RepID=T1F581_HELRO|nr:hypothetical protein HELRODRAFT_172360 [Helobdella robusta]ESO04690.1 hypothetical protein HELRODRAFT_172360 [Helobdella robusta]
MAFASPSPLCRTPSAMLGRMPSIYDHDVSNHMIRSNSFAQSQTFYNKNRNAVYNRFSKSDWENSNKNYFNLSDKERSFAERLRADVEVIKMAIDQNVPFSEFLLKECHAAKMYKK